MITDYIEHEEATIQSYMRDPEFAEYSLQEAINEGNINETRKIRRRINEAKARTQKLGYWGNVVDNAEKTAQEGKNLEVIIALMTRALGILKAAVQAR